MDASGRATTDPSGFPDEGALQPAAGHKGYGLAILVEALSGALTGAATTWEIGNWMWGDGTRPTNHGAAFVALDVAAMAPDGQFVRRIEELVDELHAAPAADEADRILVPGEREWAHYEVALRDGIALPSDALAKLREAAVTAKVPVPAGAEQEPTDPPGER